MTSVSKVHTDWEGKHITVGVNIITNVASTLMCFHMKLHTFICVLPPVHNNTIEAGALSKRSFLKTDRFENAA